MEAVMSMSPSAALERAGEPGEQDRGGDDSCAASSASEGEEGEQGTEPSEPIFLCDVCEDSVPLSGFPMNASGQRKGHACKSCASAVEVLQRKLKATWKEEYTTKYKDLRADKPRWRQTVLGVRRNAPPGGRGVKRLRPEVERLLTKHVTAKRNTKRGERVRMTYPVLSASTLPSGAAATPPRRQSRSGPR